MSVSRRQFLRASVVTGAGLGAISCGVDEVMGSDDDTHNPPLAKQSLCPVLYRSITPRVCSMRVDPRRYDEMPSHWDLLISGGFEPVAEETGIGWMITSLKGVDGAWCCVIGNEFVGSSGSSVISRFGSYTISSSADVYRNIRRFRRGVIGIAFDSRDGNARADEEVFDIFAPIHPPQEAGNNRFYVFWFQSQRFNQEGRATRSA